MARNQKLTAVIQGRRVQAGATDANLLTLTFDDESVMTIRLDGPVASITAGGTVRAVRQTGTSLCIDFGDGSTLHVTTAEVTSCVMLRDKNGVLEYVD